MSRPDPAATVPPSSEDTALVTVSASRRARAIRRELDGQAVAAGTSRKMKHGVYSVVSVQEDVLDELRIVYARAPWIDPTRDGILAEQLARLIVRLRRLDEAVIASPESVSLTSLAARTESQMLRTAEALGLSPRSAASLGLAHLDGKERAFELAQKAMEKYRTPRKRSKR